MTLAPAAASLVGASDIHVTVRGHLTIHAHPGSRVRPATAALQHTASPSEYIGFPSGKDPNGKTITTIIIIVSVLHLGIYFVLSGTLLQANDPLLCTRHLLLSNGALLHERSAHDKLNSTSLGLPTISDRIHPNTSLHLHPSSPSVAKGSRFKEFSSRSASWFADLPAEPKVHFKASILKSPGTSSISRPLPFPPCLVLTRIVPMLTQTTMTTHSTILSVPVPVCTVPTVLPLQ